MACVIVRAGDGAVDTAAIAGGGIMASMTASNWMSVIFTLSKPCSELPTGSLFKHSSDKTPCSSSALPNFKQEAAEPITSAFNECDNAILSGASP